MNHLEAAPNTAPNDPTGIVFEGLNHMLKCMLKTNPELRETVISAEGVLINWRKSREILNKEPA